MSSSQKNKYVSIFSTDKTITHAQFLAEKMCQRRASNLGRDLPKKFWNNFDEWGKYFRYQLMLGNKLVKKYKAKAIDDAVNELKYVYSLKNLRLVRLIEKYDKRVELKQNVDLKTMEPSRGRFVRKKGKLGELDG